MSVQEIQDKFGGRGPISDAFGNAAEDLAEAFMRVPQDKLNQKLLDAGFAPLKDKDIAYFYNK